jgi:hypothetical protein
VPTVFRTCCALTLALLQLATPALAQSAPQADVDARRERLRPTDLAAPPAAAPGYQPQGSPLSAQILQFTVSPFEVSRAGIEVPDLLPAVAGSPRAEAMIREGKSQVTKGWVLTISGLVFALGTLIPAAVIAGNNPHLTDSQAAWVGGLLIGGIVGIVVEAVGTGMVTGGQHTISQGINAYNADLLDGRLVAPAVTAVPPR